MVGGFEHQDGGSICVHGVCVDGRPPNKRNVNMVFQRYALFPHLTVERNIQFPLELKGMGRKQRAERVESMLELVRLSELADRRPSELSGGQAQRVALARALVGEPAVLLLDEPLAALDLNLRKAMQLELRRIQERLGTTFLYVTHDQEEALTMSDVIVLMNDGRIVQTGTPEELYEAPESVFAAEFLGETNLLRGKVTHVGEGATRVESAYTSIEASSAASVLEGQAAAVSVRPEHLEVTHMDSNGSRPKNNEVRGIVTRQIFVGNMTRLLISVGDTTVLTAECRDDQRNDFELGAPVSVSWPRDRCVVVSDA
jgi:spermidine/putrescine transport system ATP-binding protein